MNIGNAIKTLRQAKKITLKDLAGKVNISEKELKAIEKNQLEVSKEGLKTFRKALDVDKEVFLMMALERSDVSKEKREVFDQINKPVKNLLKTLVAKGD
jgi:transcriptional regulator with XRE-family HTH domain